LATCVQNKAVDSIAEKLGMSGDITFFVHGNDKNMGLISQQWTIDSQVERSKAVIEQKREILRLQRIIELLSRRLNSLERFKGGEDSIDAETRSGRRLWCIWWESFVRVRYSSLFHDLKTYERMTTRSYILLRQLKEEARARLVKECRAILCTTATASGSLLSGDDFGLVKVVTSIHTIIIDEGT
jgi:hypothetical protein